MSAVSPEPRSIRGTPAKPKLLVVEIWNLGDLVISTPFLRAASERFEVTLLAKPFAEDLRPRLWPAIRIHPFKAPWTAFKRKYRLFSWPWREIAGLRRLRSQHFDFGLSARWDPRDHLLLFAIRARERLGFPRMGSGRLLTRRLARAHPGSHRYEAWRVMASALGFQLPTLDRLPSALPQNAPQRSDEILVHTGAGQPVRVWPLARYRILVERLRQKGYSVQVACDPDQLGWWTEAGEKAVICPRTVSELVQVVEQSGAFIGNDSGPGHVAAAWGLPTFTLFGPQLPEWFAPLHPAGEWLEGKPCPYKPCSDYCRFTVPHCLENSTEEEVWSRVEPFVARVLPGRMLSTAEAH